MTSLFAAALSFHNTFARYAYSLGRDRVLPHGLSRTWARTQSPTVGSITQTVIAGAAILVAAALGADPQIALLFDATVTAGFGVLLLMTACCLAIIVYFSRHGGENVWRSKIAPALGLVGLLVVVVVAASHYGTLVGIPNGSTLAIVLPALYAIPVVAGLGWARFRRLTSHRLYQLIGSTDPFRDEAPTDAATATTDAVVL
jgi:amino acid transporter